MIDAAMIQHCADPSLKQAIVERFIAEAGSTDPLTVAVRSGDRVVLIEKPATSDEAMALLRKYVGKAVVRVGITQYPAGLGVSDVSEIKEDLVDACANIRLGTTLFGKVYRIVTKWYGNAVDEAFDDAVYAWQTGYFDGRPVFSEPDPGDIAVAAPAVDQPQPGKEDLAQGPSDLARGKAGAADPNRAEIRVDLSGIGGRSP